MFEKIKQNIKPALLTRLSNIIIIQIIFVFTAVALIIFYPAGENLYHVEYKSLKEKFNQLSHQLKLTYRKNTKENWYIEQRSKIMSELSKVLDIEKIAQSYLFIKDDNGKVKKAFTLKSNFIEGTENEIVDAFYELIDYNIINYEMTLSEGLLIPRILNDQYSVYYYQFQIDDDQPAVLVSIIDHNFVVSDKPQIMYTLLILFLASTLVSLLIIYLINKRFQEPLKRLIKGFEKTKEGELYYLVETNGDSELAELATAFNNMSKTLWNNHKKLKNYNTRLEETNSMLSESQEFLKTVIDSSPNCIITASDNGGIMVFNQKASEVFGVSCEEALGKNINELFANSIEEIKSLSEQQNKEHSLEVLCRRSDGSLFPAYVIILPIMCNNKKISANLYIIRDISESKSFQDMMIRLDRYCTRGEMAGDIAHEINNFLAILSGNVELIPLFLKKGNMEKINKKLELMKETVLKISRFTDGLMDINEDEVKFEKTDINQLIETVLAFLKPQNKFDEIEISTDLSTNIPLVELDSGQLQQLMVNLIYNASEAFEEKKPKRKISISSRLVTVSGEQYIRIEVYDNGIGIPSDKVELLFKKRFTTKRKGHGIGLITCKKIVDTHNGTISYEYNNGSIFSIEMPVKRKSKTPQKTESKASKITAPTV